MVRTSCTVQDRGRSLICYPASMETQGFWRSAELQFVESRRARDSSACYAPHTHDRLSIGAVDRGHSLFFCHAQSTPLVAGDVVLVPAGVVHACNPVAGRAWAYQMLYLDEDWVALTLGETFRCDGQVLTHLPLQMFVRPVYAMLDAVNRCLFSDAATLEKETQLARFIGDVLLPLQRADIAALPEAANRGVERARALIEARCGNTLRLAELAQVAGLSPYYFVRAFRAQVGMTPHAWQLDARIRRARRLLDAGVPLAELALQLGFADQSHFQRVFRQRVAATPRQYQRNFIQD